MVRSSYVLSLWGLKSLAGVEEARYWGGDCSGQSHWGNVPLGSGLKRNLSFCLASIFHSKHVIFNRLGVRSNP